MNEDAKRMAAWAAVDEVRPGMLVGLGTGSTAAFVIERLGEKVKAGLAISAVATSLRSEEMARSLGIPLLDFAGIESLDLAIDGADEIDDDLRAIKGAGGAMLREKIVATAARRMIVVADASKRVARIGRAKLPVEILPFAQAFVMDRLERLERLERLGAQSVLRADYLTDQGNRVIDCSFASMPDPAGLAARISAIPGALGHGLFLDEVACAYIGDGNSVIRLERQATTGTAQRSTLNP